MRRIPIPHIAFIFILGVAAAVPVYHILIHRVSLVSLASYVISVLAAWRLFLPYSLPHTGFTRREWIWIAVCITAHLVTLALVAAIPTHFHQDEFITAFTSLTLPPLTRLNWFGVFPEVWVSQFPVLFHILQKPFFVFGPSVWAVRISVWPYAALIVFYLYWLSSRLFSRKTGYLALILYLFFPPSVYILSMGLHFASSELFYMAAVTHFMLYLSSCNRSHLLPTALFAAASYLTYTSSYSTLPVILVSGAIALAAAREKRHRLLVDMGRMIAVCAVAFLPFLVTNFTGSGFLFQRVAQVNAWNGSWSHRGPDTSLLLFVANQTGTALKSLIVPGIGGTGGYSFGNQALLDPVSFLLLTAGVVWSVVMVVRDRSKSIPVLAVALSVPFVAGFILTTHPPPFHRISLIYPLFALTMALPFTSISSLPRHRIATLAAGAIMLLYTAGSMRHLTLMLTNDRLHANTAGAYIAYAIEKDVPRGTPVVIAAYPAFYLIQELTFRFSGHHPMRQDIKETMLPRYDGKTPIVILNMNDSEKQSLLRRYPSLVILNKILGVSLWDMTLALPERHAQDL